MIGSFGILSTGLTPKRLTDITDQIGISLAGDLGASFNLLPQTPEGQLVKRFAEQVADLWEFGEQAYNSKYPDTASGVSLDNARVLTNNFRIPATASVANNVTFTGTAGVTIPAGTQVSVQGSPGSIFQTVQDLVISGGGTVTGALVCTADGPVIAPATKLSVIVTAVTGLTSVSNPTDAELGTLVETDAAFRIRSAQELNTSGTGTYSGLLQFVQKVANVSQVFLFINDTDVTDASGLLPHSVQLIVVGGVDQDILNAIFAAKGAGIQTNGTVSGTVTDSQGTAHTVAFSRLTQLPIYMAVSITANVNPALGPVYPGNGDDLVAAAILDFGALYLPGQTVVTTGFFTPINTIPGVLGATILVGTSYPPVSAANISVPVGSIAQFLAANLTVTHT